MYIEDMFICYEACVYGGMFSIKYIYNFILNVYIIFLKFWMYFLKIYSISVLNFMFIIDKK